MINSYVSDWVDDDSDTQAVLMSGYASVFAVINNYLEATGENVYTDNVETIDGVIYVPSDGEIRGNLMRKLVEWNSRGWNNTKNLFEMKAGQRILFEGNVLDTNYRQAQETAINIKIGDEDPRKFVHNVTVRKNIIRNAANGIKMCATQCNSAANTNIATGLAVYNNIFENVTHRVWRRGRRQWLPPHRHWARACTWTTTRSSRRMRGSTRSWRGAGVSNGQTLVITNNIWRYARNALTAAEMTAVSSAAVYTNNLIVGGTCSNYPAGNRCPTS